MGVVFLSFKVVKDVVQISNGIHNQQLKTHLQENLFFAGAIPSKILRVMDFCGLQSISLSTFYRHQKAFLLRTVSNIWEREESILLNTLSTKPLLLGGDGRNDSMGHSAKYGSYTLMELEENKIINIQLVQVQ